MTNLLLSLQDVVLPNADPLPLPAHPAIFVFLLYLTFVLHMIAMNLTLGGTIFQTFNSFRTNEQQDKFSRYLTYFLPISMSFTVTLGIAPLLFIQVMYGQIFFTTSVLMAWIWLLLLAFLLIAYYGLYYYQMKRETSPFARRWAPMISMIMLLLIALIFIMNFRLFFRAEAWKQIYEGGFGGFFLNVTHPQVWPFFFHYIMASMSVIGLLAIIHGWYKQKTDEAYSAWAIKFGGTIFIVHTLAQFIFGSWILLSLPRPLLKEFMFGNPYPTALLFTGMGLTVVALGSMILSVRKRRYGIFVVLPMVLVVAIIALMTMIRDYTRNYLIADYFSMDRFVVEPQWGTIAIFSVLLVGGLATVAWMLIAIARGKGAEEGELAG